jgi:hypothetical protein
MRKPEFVYITGTPLFIPFGALHIEELNHS